MALGADSMNWLRRKSSRRLIPIAITTIFTLYFFLRWFYPSHSSPLSIKGKPYKQALVVASLKEDDTSWIEKHLPQWYLIRYIADDQNADLTVPKNKGREAMVYLTFIIDAYDQLPDLTIFMHSLRYQWHNEDPIYDGVPMLQNLQIPYLLSQGYTNLRCVWLLGCPAELTFDTPSDPDKSTQMAYPQAFMDLFPGLTLPSSIGVTCCAQFAVTRETIHRHTKAEYEHYRDWLLHTDLPDHVNGRIFEYSWHFIFGKDYTHCPNAKQCYCNVFGLCELECEEDGAKRCGERWPYPPSATLPEGWPRKGWEGEFRDESELERLRMVAMKVNKTDMGNGG